MSVLFFSFFELVKAKQDNILLDIKLRPRKSEKFERLNKSCVFVFVFFPNMQFTEQEKY